MWWTIIGGLVEAIGLIVTGWGIRQTWVNAADERFLAPVLGRAASLRRHTTVLADRLRRRPQASISIDVDAADHAFITDHVSVRVGIAPLDRTAPQDEQIAFIDTQVRQLLAQTQDADERQAEALRTVGDEADRVSAEIQQVRESLSAIERRLTLLGLRTEATGLGLVGVGLLMQVVGSIV